MRSDQTTTPDTTPEKTYTQAEVLALLKRCRVVHVMPNDFPAHQHTIYLRLPVELQPIAMDGVCSCGASGCGGKDHKATWDLLAVHGVKGEHPWTCHGPEYR